LGHTSKRGSNLLIIILITQKYWSLKHGYTILISQSRGTPIYPEDWWTSRNCENRNPICLIWVIFPGNEKAFPYEPKWSEGELKIIYHFEVNFW